MSFVGYLRDKLSFVTVYLFMMLFVSSVILLSVNLQDAVRNLMYANGVCLVAICTYIVFGYYYRRGFYQELQALAGSAHEHFLAAVPEPRTHEQMLYLDLVKKTYQEQSARLTALQGEIREHQEFIMSWIHEVKVPISASYLVMENSAGKSIDAVVDKLEDELQRIEHLVEQALYYSRIDSFSRDYFITEVQLRNVIKTSVKKYAKLFTNKRIRCQITDLELAVHSDPKWLCFIVDQIVANALKYTDAGGEIRFVLAEDRKEKRLLIQDAGIGIPSADLPRVFEKGFTGTTGRKHTKSTGMGLYLANQLALKLGHNLTIESEEGRSTTVTIHFPRVSNYVRLS